MTSLNPALLSTSQPWVDLPCLGNIVVSWLIENEPSGGNFARLHQLPLVLFYGMETVYSILQDSRSPARHARQVRHDHVARIVEEASIAAAP